MSLAPLTLDHTTDKSLLDIDPTLGPFYHPRDEPAGIGGSTVLLQVYKGGSGHGSYEPRLHLAFDLSANICNCSNQEDGLAYMCPVYIQTRWLL